MERLWDGGVYQKAGLRPFQMDASALDAFPFELWGRLESRHLDRSSVMNLAYCDPAGHPPLREAIAAYLRAHRAMACDPEQIIITHGSRQALNLAAQVLLDPGDLAWIEDPVAPTPAPLSPVLAPIWCRCESTNRVSMLPMAKHWPPGPALPMPFHPTTSPLE